MTSIESIADISAAVAAKLTTVLPGRVYRNRGPSDPESAAPYCIVYTQPPLLGGPAGAWNDDATTTVQVKSIGNGSGSCERTADTVRLALLAGITPPAGRGLSAPIRSSGGQSARPDEDTTVTVWQADELFAIRTTPA